MKRLFFIYTMPRSGSAWLSLFLSQPGSFCYHEPLADHPSWEGLSARMIVRPEEVVGAIDTSAYARSDFFKHEMTVYALHRPVIHIEKSVKKLGIHSYDAVAEYPRFKTKVGGMTRIEYKGLSDLNYLEHIWEQVTGLPFDRERAAYLKEMHVQRDLEAVKRRAGLD